MPAWDIVAVADGTIVAATDLHVAVFVKHTIVRLHPKPNEMLPKWF